MVLPSSGQISLSNVSTEFEAPAPYKMSDLYKGGQYVDDNAGSTNIPTSGELKLSNFYSAYKLVILLLPYIPPSIVDRPIPIVVDAMQYVYNDTNRTTLATNNQTVGSWTDPNNTSTIFTTGLSTTMRPIYRTEGSTTNTYLDFTVASTGSGSSHFKGLTSSQNVVFTSSGFTIVWYKKYTITPTNNLVFNSNSFTNINNQGGWLQINVSSGAIGYSFNMGNGTTLNTPSFVAENWDAGNWHVWAIRFRSTGVSSSEVVIYRDGILQRTHTFNAPLVSGTISGVSLGSYNNSFAPWNAHLRYFSFFNVPLTDTEMAALKPSLF